MTDEQFEAGLRKAIKHAKSKDLAGIQILLADPAQAAREVRHHIETGLYLAQQLCPPAKQTGPVHKDLIERRRHHSKNSGIGENFGRQCAWALRLLWDAEERHPSTRKPFSLCRANKCERDFFRAYADLLEAVSVVIAEEA